MKLLLFFVLSSLLISVSIPSMASANYTPPLVNTARAYIGTPYSYGGTTASGFDCSGYIQFIFNETGISIPRTTDQQYDLGKSIKKSNLEAGDLVFFNTTGHGVSHVGMYIGSNRFIHTSTSKGVMISSIHDPAYWGSRYLGARRVKDFTFGPLVVAVNESSATEGASNYVAHEDNRRTQTTLSNTAATDPHLEAIPAITDADILSANDGTSSTSITE